MPDYQWRNKLWELKGVTSVNGADKSLQKAIKQIRKSPGGVILNLLEDVDMTVFEKQIFSRVRRSQIDGLDIMVILNGKLVMVLRYKK